MTQKNYGGEDSGSMNYDITSKKPFIVYCHTNLINGKKYIGITCQKPNDRFRDGKGYSSSPHFHHAIKMYGWDSFQTEILYSGLSADEAKEKEIELIKKFNTRNNNFGYNITPGGELCSGEDHPWFGKHHSEESKEYLRKINTGKYVSEETRKRQSVSLKGRVVTEETKQKMRGPRPNMCGKNNPRYGKPADPEHMAKMVKASKTPEAIAKMKAHKTWYSGADNPNAKSVICIETGKIYHTLNDAAHDNGCSPSKVSAVCHGHRKHTNKLHFKFVKEEE